MNFLIADTFTASFNRLAGQDQKAVKASVFDLQMDPTGNGLQLHRIGNSKDPNFWSARVNRDVRLIVHKTGESMLVAYVDHHDDAYSWAERRRIEAHPRTGAVQIVEVRERVEEVEPPERFDFVAPRKGSSRSRSICREKRPKRCWNMPRPGRFRFPRRRRSRPTPLRTPMRCAGYGRSRTRRSWSRRWLSRGRNGESSSTRRNAN
jgi:hypothetical protein